MKSNLKMTALAVAVATMAMGMGAAQAQEDDDDNVNYTKNVVINGDKISFGGNQVKNMGSGSDGMADGKPTYNTPTNGATLPAGADTATSVEVWFRHRTDIEERIKEAKHGAALGHLPSGKPQLNTVWM